MRLHLKGTEDFPSCIDVECSIVCMHITERNRIPSITNMNGWVFGEILL